MKHITTLTLLFLTIIMLVSCSDQSSATNISEVEKQFATSIPITDMNRSVQVTLESQESSIKAGSDIDLLIFNKSSKQINFNNDSYVRLLVSPDQLQWLDVPNEVTYYGKTVLSPQGTPLLDFVHTVVRPRLDQARFNFEKGEVRLRIVIIGEISEEDNSTGQKVGTYVDVVLVR